MSSSGGGTIILAAVKPGAHITKEDLEAIIVALPAGPLKEKLESFLKD